MWRTHGGTPLYLTAKAAMDGLAALEPADTQASEVAEAIARGAEMYRRIGLENLLKPTAIG